MKAKTTLAAAVFAAFSAASATDMTRDCALRLLDARAGESPRRYEEAAREVAREAAEGRPLHQFLLALVSKEPDAPESARLSDEVRERYLELNRSRIRIMAQPDPKQNRSANPLALYLLYLDTGNATFLKRAADGDNAQALNELGAKRIRNSKGDLANDATLKECFGYFGRAAGKDDPNGHYNIGVCYLYGWGFRKDAALAMDHLKRAAEMDQPKAINLIGEMYRDGITVEQNPELAAKYFSQSSMLGYPRGQYNYAVALLAGDGIEKNEARAASLLKSASDRGLIEATDAYAKCLYDGVGVEASNPEEAVSMWRRGAVNLKYPPSMDKLATSYREGKGIEKNEAWAVAWYKRAADYGYVTAMRHLADCYDAGTGGLAKNHYNANWWRTKANATEGDRMARVWLSSHKLEKK